MPSDTNPAHPAHPATPNPISSSLTPPAVEVRDLSKCYRIYKRPIDRIKQVTLGPLGKNFYSPFWALREVSFSVQPGEAVGIIGRNGSGKSTLLQIVAGTLTPTEGEATVRGRVAALLELGSGFNQHFSGRENVFMAGTILGIPRDEMEDRFDEIAEFADIGEFIERPISMYSSGMHARLAFAVAASVKPDILILDEILAVGDIGFRHKCMTRMRELIDGGVTVLFVNHGSDAIKSMCQKGLLLIDGQCGFYGDAEDAVDRYIEHMRRSTNERAGKLRPDLVEEVEFKNDVGGTLRYGSGRAQLEHVHIVDSSGHPTEGFGLGETVIVEAMVRAHSDIDRVDLAVVVRDRTGIDLIGSAATDTGPPLPSLGAGQGVRVRIRFVNKLRPGAYGVSLTLTRLADRPGAGGVTLDHIASCASFNSLREPGRSVRHKFHQEMVFEVEHAEPERSEDAGDGRQAAPGSA